MGFTDDLPAAPGSGDASGGTTGLTDSGSTLAREGLAPPGSQVNAQMPEPDAGDQTPTDMTGQPNAATEQPGTPQGDNPPDGDTPPADGTAQAGSDGTPAEEVFDPQAYQERLNALPPEAREAVLSLARSYQADYTRKMQEISGMRTDVQQNQHAAQLMQALQANPQGTIQMLAQQYGVNMGAPADGNGAGQSDPADWQPKNWQDARQTIAQEAVNQVLQQLQPVIQQTQEAKQSTIEAQLNDIDPAWKRYEPQMIRTLQMHPTLSSNPEMLYRMSVPAEVLESRATQRALKLLQSKTSSGRVSNPTGNVRKPTTELAPAATIQAAYEQAKQAVNPDGSIKAEFAHLYPGMPVG
jgi:hypothetical protein